jgi:hypothetical protein
MANDLRSTVATVRSVRASASSADMSLLLRSGRAHDMEAGCGREILRSVAGTRRRGLGRPLSSPGPHAGGWPSLTSARAILRERDRHRQSKKHPQA